MSDLDRHVRPIKHTTTCCISLNPVDIVSNLGKDVSNVVQQASNAVGNAGQQAINDAKNTWAGIRDPLESAGVVALNYYLPGSSLLTENLVSKGSQAELSTNYGAAALMISGGMGIYNGNLNNYGKLYEGGKSAVGLGEAAGMGGVTATGGAPVASGAGPGTAVASGSAPAATAGGAGMSPGQIVAASTLASLYAAPRQPALPTPPAPITPPQAGQMPDVNTFIANAAAGNQSGYASTLLTGGGGVDPNSLTLRKNTLLGT